LLGEKNRSAGSAFAADEMGLIILCRTQGKNPRVKRSHLLSPFIPSTEGLNNIATLTPTVKRW
jgi:hypothetical protein